MLVPGDKLKLSLGAAIAADVLASSAVDLPIVGVLALNGILMTDLPIAILASLLPPRSCLLSSWTP
jgi:hypothetical protein